MVINLLHRGACGCETNTGDGAGMLLQLPHRFLRKEADRLGIDLPEPGAYGAGMVFLPRDAGTARRGREAVRGHRRRGRPAGARLAHRPHGRLRPRQDTARSGEPVIRQILIGRGAALAEHADAHARFERTLYVIRKRVARAVEQLHGSGAAPVLRRQPVVEHHRLQGDADRRPGGGDVPRPQRIRTWSRRWRSCTSASRPTRFRPGRSRTRTATSRTTARSTRCAATSTGCARARRCAAPICSATTSASCSR